MSEKIAVVGLGYVGLPVCVAFASKFDAVVGFDINEARVDELRRNIDSTRELDSEELAATGALFTSNSDDIVDSTFYVVAVPTPIDGNKKPNLKPVESASRTVGKALKTGDVVVYESTVFPGVTEDVCAKILEGESGLKAGVDFFLGYSPERINPGDKEHTITKITKVVAGDSPATLERVATTYEAIIDAGVFRAASIKTAEAAKVIENTQRDINIALMNEIAMIFDRLELRTLDVLEAAGTKWNFLPFRPGLVGGHCIGVDPYYLTSKAESLGYHPEVILAGRRINDSMGSFVAQKTVKLLIQQGRPVAAAKVGILGLTFKENVPDIRNSRVPDIVKELVEFGVNVVCHDPMAYADEVEDEMALNLSDIAEWKGLDALVLAVPHQTYLERDCAELLASLGSKGILIDVKSALSASVVSNEQVYWSL